MKVVTVGSAMIDSIAIVDDDRIERMSMRNADSSFMLIEAGRKIEARKISQHCGGGGVNTAVCMARLGCDVATILKLGQDDRAETVLRRLADEKVSTRWVMRDGRADTGSAVMIAAHDRDAAVFTFRGANTLLAAQDLRPDMMAADLVYIASLSNEAADCFPSLVEMAKAAGAKICTNPGIRQLTRRAAPFVERLGDIDILSMNRVEAAALVPQLVDHFGEGGAPLGPIDGAEPPDLARLGFSSGGFDMSLAKFCSALRRCGVGHVLITDGKRGAYAASDGAITFQPAREARVVGTAGAGDAFAATFAAMLASTGDAAAALRAATVNAASVIGQPDTQSGLMDRAALDAALSAPLATPPALIWRADA